MQYGLKVNGLTVKRIFMKHIFIYFLVPFSKKKYVRYALYTFHVHFNEFAVNF